MAPHDTNTPKEARRHAFPLIGMAILLVVVLLGFLYIMLRRMWDQFVERTVEPAMAEVEETWDGVEARAEGFWGRIGAWFRTWRAKK